MIKKAIKYITRPFKVITCNHYDMRLPERTTILNNGYLATIQVKQCLKCDRIKRTVVPK